MKILFLFIFISTISFGQSKAYKEMLEEYYDGFPTISIESASKKVGDASVYFMDTRKIQEFNISHIKGAKHVDYDHFHTGMLKSLPKNTEIIVYCSIGARSQTIGKKLKKAGFTNVRNMYGGLFHWANSEYPMYNALGRKTNSIHGYSPAWGKWVTKGNVVY